MHLAETSLIKKYENDIGTSIVDVGGDVNHDTHWLPYLDDQIRKQLVGDEIIDEKIDKKLDERGLTQDAIDSWNQAVLDLGDLKTRVSFLEDLPATQITQNQIDSWDQAILDLRGAVRFDIVQDLTEGQQRQARENIGLEKDDMYESQWWDNDLN